ncbi:helix-turn-helix domain-containing protein [Paenibacillus motobuensis]|uniref:Insertion element IS150 protein InsJ-like helix-turn-helix domain-containing protein n=1 Tax=Paenibacillus motobuensis TaxID=295324 RepID=A0ABN0YKD9_9BACL
MANKGQKFQHYPESVKREAIRLHLEEKWTYREITEHLGIHDKDRVKKWMRKYREEGERVFEDRRGNPFRESTEEYRYIRRLEMENAVLKKWLAILNQEVYKKNGRSSKL